MSTPAALGGSLRLRDLAVLGFRLRWKLVRNRASRMGKRSPLLTVVVGVLYAAGTIVGLFATRGMGPEAADRRVLLHLSSLAFGWIFGPILIGGVDETVDPTRLALLPLTRSQLFCVQAVAALSGVGPLAATAGLVIGLPLGLGTTPTAAAVAAVGAVVGIAMVLGLARIVAALLALAQRTRAGRDLGILLAAFLGGTLFVVAQLAADMGGRRADRFGGVLRWAPWGWVSRSVVSARTGSIGTSLGWLVVSAAFTVAVLAGWARLSAHLLTSGERSARSRAWRRDRVLPGADSVLSAALARQWIYLRRSPNTRVALLFGAAFGVAFPVLQILQHGSRNAAGAAFGVLLAMLVNIGASANLLGFDAGSLWIEVLCGGPRREHMMARSIAVLPNLLVPTWLAAVVIGTWTQTVRYVLVVSLVAVPVAVIILAEGMVTSLVAGWPLPDGDNPFGNRQASDGRGARLALIGLGGLFSIVLLASPVIGSAWVLRDEASVWLVPVVGLGWAALIGAGVLRWAGRRLRGNEPELLARLAPLALH